MRTIGQERWQRFKGIKRGYYSFIILIVLFVISLLAEFIVNNRALIVKYEGQYFFPVVTDLVRGAIISGDTFGLDYQYETDYLDLQRTWRAENSENWVLMPIVPFGPYNIDLPQGAFAPTPPDAAYQHYLGTDNAGRDVIARLFYGFRVAFLFSLTLMVVTYIIGIIIGALMGYRGGYTDLIGQRFIEIWQAIPFLYMVMILAAIIRPSFFSLILIMIAFGWMGMTWMVRTSVYKEKARDYVLAARALGATHWRVILKHILPNVTAVIVTLLPFSFTGGIMSLTALDYLGFGLQPPTPSWGELLQQGTGNLSAYWIIYPTVALLIVVLVLITFVGEAVREAYDPKKFTVYQ